MNRPAESEPRLLLIGDRNDSIPGHAGILRSFQLARLGRGWSWLPSSEVTSETLANATGIWLVPGSPYQSTEGALLACRWARERGVPFLGTCGGFQHAVMELAVNVLGLSDAVHAEMNPDAATQVIHLLACGLVGVRAGVRFVPGSRLAALAGTEESEEGYQCRYGVNPEFRAALESAEFRFTAFDPQGEIRGGELSGHPFFFGTLFQPERAALSGRLHPIVSGWMRAAGASVSG
jgi:CTP synthase (UTP-ammonia lyase)